ncbi:MAG: ATP synthase F1 subunit epsilon [Planctomycetaceae bacterium]
MIAATTLRLVLVTPETTLFDVEVTSVQFPLFDGQVGVLPGRAPMVGRLGAGELKYTSAKGEGRFFIDGGFAQIKGQVVSVLTHKAIAVSEIDLDKVMAEYDAAQAMSASTDAEFAVKEHAIEQARKQINLRRG